MILCTVLYQIKIQNWTIVTLEYTSKYSETFEHLSIISIVIFWQSSYPINRYINLIYFTFLENNNIQHVALLSHNVARNDTNEEQNTRKCYRKLHAVQLLIQMQRRRLAKLWGKWFTHSLHRIRNFLKLNPLFPQITHVSQTISICSSVILHDESMQFPARGTHMNAGCISSVTISIFVQEIISVSPSLSISLSFPSWCVHIEERLPCLVVGVSLRGLAASGIGVL